MENEKMQVNFAPGVTEATLRVIELHEENELPVLEPDKVELAGTIGSVYEFLLKRISEKEQINQKRCYILVDREKMTLKLVTNETDSRNKATVRGELKYYPKFLEFGINTSKTWEPVQLSKFFKMNRAFFKDAQYNMELVTVLKNSKPALTQKWKTPDKTTVVALTITAKLSTPIFRPHSILLFRFSKVARQKKLKWKSLQMWMGVTFDYPFALPVQK